jgi:hypothetical protein
VLYVTVATFEIWRRKPLSDQVDVGPPPDSVKHKAKFKLELKPDVDIVTTFVPDAADCDAE